MFGYHSQVCMIIAEKLSSSHHYYIAGADLSYISLNTGELIFTCNLAKFEVLGLPSVKWDKEHFIDIDKTANELLMEILKQAGGYRYGYKLNFAHRGPFFFTRVWRFRGRWTKLTGTF